jgi:hypothetical protein
VGREKAPELSGLLYKEDWEETKARFEAWWAGEVVDRVALAVTAPRRAANLPRPRDDEAKYRDADFLIRFYEEAFSATYFGGEAAPAPLLMLGWAAWGCPVHFRPETVWMDPILGPEDDLGAYRFNWSNRGWVELQELTRRLAEAARGEYLLALAPLLPPGDALSSYLGPDQLCVDLLERPEQVRALYRHAIGVWKGMCERQWEVIGAAEQGYVCWLNLWSPTPHSTLQADFSCLISKRLFDDFVAPEVDELSRWLDHSMYHLDGPGARQHLETLLSLPKLGGIQWTPGAGNPGAMHWMPMLKRVQAAGKLLHIALAPNEVEAALGELRPEGLFIRTGCSSEEEAKELLNKAKGWTRARGR